MDRNRQKLAEAIKPSVALRKESVDRNLIGCIDRAIDIVALRKESVDRNCMSPIDVLAVSASLSARRAWIEMMGFIGGLKVIILSLSARRAWIEIGSLVVAPVLAVGSLSARRAWIEIIDDFDPSSTRKGRSPQGERG